ncbi:MAG: hypothetical protein ACE5KT_02160 [Methanosarcinales archaeon]
MPTIELDMLIAFINALDNYHQFAEDLFFNIREGSVKDMQVATSAYKL